MIYENENIPAETIPHYMWMQCEDGSGSLHNENQDIVVEYDIKFLSRRTRKCFTQKKRNMKLSE